MTGPGGESLEPRVVPVYVLTGGRTRPAGDLQWETLVTATRSAEGSSRRLRREPARIVALGQQPVSVAEIAADLKVPVGVAQVLVADLVAAGLLQVHRPALTEDGKPSPEVLERLIAGLRAGT